MSRTRRSQLAALLGIVFGLGAMTAAYAQGTAGAEAAAPAPHPHGIFGSIISGLSHQPFITLFLLVAGGYALGAVKFKGITLGATASTLIIALAVSLWGAQRFGIQFNIPEFASTIFFNLFMFSVGMKVGPQFLTGLRRDAGKFIFMGLFIPALSLATIFAIRAIFHPAPGLVPGIFAGANTATPGIGAAQAAFTSGAAKLPAGTNVGEAMSNMSTAFAFTYCISMVLFIVLTKVPDMFGANTSKAAKEFEAKVGASSDSPLPGAGDEFFSTTLPLSRIPVTIRTYEIENPKLEGISLGQLRVAYPDVSVEQVFRGGQVMDARDEVVLKSHDEVTLYGQISRLIRAATQIGPEVYEHASHEMGAQTVDVVVHKGQAVGRKLGDLAKDVGHGLYLNAMFRAGDAIPHGPEVVVHKGDVLRVTGTRWRIKILEQETGSVIEPSLGTDIVTLALGLTLGALVGMITVHVGHIRLTLGAAVGLLLVGIALSTIRTRYPGLGGPYPEPARQLIEDLGLNVFIAILGINSGAGVIKAIQAGALTPILVGCMVVGFIPPIIAWFVGSKIMKMNLALLLGAVSGGRCNSAGMRASQEATHSTVPAISYPATFAISNIVLTLLSYVMAMVG
ncbi:aspartate:alanine exchanger family transporter [Labilithrix luteola]|uniref:aspartate:alanine exchanger family transporter n=1 Tax=Labilithrix luteola TaxID=1391654 RepID=UPI0011BA6501|nr:hypothetical protein [Labilithrix luteola]